MTPDEAIRLLAHCAAFDNRKPSQAAAQAWAAALHDIPLDADALGAVARFYATPDGEGQKWIQPHHVRAHRAAIRSDRIGPAGPGLHPAPPPADPDDVQGYLRALRQQQAGIADGHTPRDAILAAPAEPEGSEHARTILAEFHARQDTARRRKAEQAAAEREALRAYRDAVEHLLALPDRGERALAAARDDLLGDTQAAQGFPLLQALPGVMDEHRITIHAARLTAEEEPPCAPTAG